MDTTNKYEAKALQVLGLLTGKQWAYITAVAIDKNDGEFDQEVLKDFISSIDEPVKKEIYRISVN